MSTPKFSKNSKLNEDVRYIKELLKEGQIQ